MTDENLEETQENPAEEDTTETSEDETEEETSIEEQETSEEPEIAPSEEKGKVRQDVYERMKRAEKDAKELRGKLKDKPSVKASSDPLKLAKTVSALKDYSPEELDDIALISKAKDISLEEAAEAEEARTLIAARRIKVAKDKKTPEPSSAFATPKGTKDIKEMSNEEFEAFDKRESRKQRGKME